jgi:hypothetical protein
MSQAGGSKVVTKRDGHMTRPVDTREGMGVFSGEWEVPRGPEQCMTKGEWGQSCSVQWSQTHFRDTLGPKERLFDAGCHYN